MRRVVVSGRSGWELVSLAAAGLTLTPLVCLLLRAAQAGRGDWTRLWRTRIPELLVRSIGLAAGVAVATGVIGVWAAWMVTRYEFPGRRTWTWLLAAPLAVPPYILAFVASDLFGRGIHHRYLPIATVLTLATYPYVYLLTRSSLSSLHVGFEEVARAAGAKPGRVFRGVLLPMIRPGIAAGLFLVVLYCLADFGAVSLLGYETFTRAIYDEFKARFDLESASALAAVLVALAIVPFALERTFRRRARYHQTEGAPRTAPRPRLGRLATVLTWLGFGALFAAGFGAVVVRLVVATALDWDPAAARDLGRDLANTVALSTLAATIAVAVGFVVAYASVRLRSVAGAAAVRAIQAGYVLPGPIAAVGVLLAVTAIPGGNALLGTAAVLVAAYLVRFLPQALQACESSLAQMAPSIEEAGRASGANAWRVLGRVTLPIARPGLVAGWVLVFLASAKELPATLMLRPVDYDTLAVRVWQQTENEFYTLASPAALLLVLVTLPAAAFALARELGDPAPGAAR